MGPERQTRRQWQPTKLEQNVERMARRRVTRQLLGVPWDRFRKAYAAYPQWEALALWTRAIVEAEGRAPSWLAAILKKRCPGFMKDEALSNEPGLLAYRLGEWIHTQAFRQAREEGWYNALDFFGVHALRSQAAWAFWVHCEREWRRKRPRRYPTFEKWWQAGQKYEVHKGIPIARIAEAVERYGEWQAFGYWLVLCLETNKELPDRVAAELKRRCPGFVEFDNPSALKNQKEQTRAWRHFVRWIGDHYFARANEQGWFELVVEQVHNDPRRVRMIQFWKRSNQNLFLDPAIAYPSFREWRRAADSYIAD
jgi:hypothetical protein